ncbi:MAG: glycosyltransferase family 2 protein [bacterium]|nr:glycosyltransferase family 2 protein [bacterium]
MPKVQIQIVTHNSEKYLEPLFAGIAKQEGVEFSVLIIDNASTDATLGWVRTHHPKARIIANQENRGFARAHNQGFAECQAPYVLALNPDVELQEGCLPEMLRVMEAEPPLNPPLNTGGESSIAAVTPKLYKILPSDQKSGIIDSLGIDLMPWGQVANIGEYTSENAKNKPTERVWGISGACALYRLSALQSVKDEHGIYDERFWMYKEDADLAWRLNRAGFRSALAPNAIALHLRSVQKGDRPTRQDRFKQESIKNHLLMLRKNLSWCDWWRMPAIITYEFLKFIYIAIFETRNLKAYYGSVRHHT